MSGLCKLEMFAPAVRTHMRDIVNSLTLQLRSGRLSAGTDRNACVKPIPPSCKDWPNCPARERDSPGPNDDARAEPPGARPVHGLDRADCDPLRSLHTNRSMAAIVRGHRSLSDQSVFVPEKHPAPGVPQSCGARTRPAPMSATSAPGSSRSRAASASTWALRVAMRTAPDCRC